MNSVLQEKNLLRKQEVNASSHLAIDPDRWLRENHTMKNLYKPSLVSSETASLQRSSLSFSEIPPSFLQALLKKHVYETIQYQDASSPTHYEVKKRRVAKKEKVVPMIPLPEWLRGERLSQFLVSLQPKIESVARGMYGEVKSMVSVSIDDLAQEGLIRVWKSLSGCYEIEAVNEQEFQYMCIKRARWAMVDYIHGLRKQHAWSLDQYLTVEGDETTLLGELAEPLPESVGGIHVDRHDLLEVLEQLPRHERLLVFAMYQMEDENGVLYGLKEVKRQYRFTDVEISIIVRRAIKTLACLFTYA